MKVQVVRTPCIGVCSTGIGDTVCRGCKRFAHEVIAWNAYSQDERRAVLARIDALLSTIVERWLLIDDVDRLQQQLRAQQITFDASRQPASWVVELLKAGASQIADPADFGLRLLPEAQGLGLRALRERIEMEVHALSQAHYERYFETRPLV